MLSSDEQEGVNMNLQKTLDKLSTNINEVNEWAEEEYNKYFSEYFKGEVDLYNKMKTSKSQITDEELEWVLTDLPMELFAVTEQLSKLKTAQEVIKLGIKQQEREYIKLSSEKSETKRKEEAAALTAEDRLLVTVYDQIADRVSRQMTFSKELIMSAKKIWDARRSDGIPLPEVTMNPDRLPEYFK